MSEESFRTTFRYSDVIVGLFALGIAVAALLVATDEITSWGLKDSLNRSTYDWPSAGLL
jgi:hypothetical protein